eukprot:5428546-Prymnesium_polylepis.1
MYKSLGGSADEVTSPTHQSTSPHPRTPPVHLLQTLHPFLWQTGPVAANVNGVNGVPPATNGNDMK